MNYFTVLTAFLYLILGTDISFAQTAKYHLTIDKSDNKIIQVEAEFMLQDSILYMSPNGPLPDRWPQYVNELKLHNHNGDPLPISKTGGHWTTPAHQGQPVTLSYQVSLTHPNQQWPGGIDGVAFTKDWGYFFSGRTVFIMNGETQTDISVDIDAPEDWRVSTPWNRSSAGKNIFSLSGYHNLTESLVMAGKHKRLTVSQYDLKLQFVLGGNGIIQQQQRIKELAQQTMSYYINLMSGVPITSDKDSNSIMVVINEADQVDGEVIGSHISMLLNPQSPPQEQLVGWFMFVHEFFHLWNGKTITVSSTKEDWFKEGITNYYTLKSLYQVGFINEQALLGVLNGLFFQRYQADSGLGTLSMREAASGFDKDNHWGLIYGGGLFAGIALDMMIRENTNNQKSLDDLMRRFYKTYGGSGKSYSTEDLLLAVNELGNSNFKPFFEKYIYGSTPIPIEQYLSKAGYSVTIKDGQLVVKPKTKLSPLEQEIQSGFLGR